MTSRFTSNAALFVSVLLLLFLTSSASAAVVSCGQTITTDTTLENDLVDCPGDGVVIGADGITLDLNGHTTDGAGAGAGVRVAEHNDVTIENGTIHQFGVGIELIDSSGDSIRSNTIVANFTGVEGGGLHGATNGNAIERNFISTTGGTAISMSRNTNDIAVSRNVISVPAGAIAVSFGKSSGTIVKNRISGGDIGILLELNGPFFVSKNVVVGTAVDGISLIATMAIVAGNVSIGNGDDGIDVVDGSMTKLVRNHADLNGDLGIEALTGVIDGGGNRASGNDNPLECLGVVCK
jgi:hypothetical protein